MATIINPTPIQTTGSFNGMWVTNLHIVFPTEQNPKGRLIANWLPYDGKTILAVGGKHKILSLPSNDKQTTAVLAALVSEVQRQSDKKVDVKTISVMGNDPAKPVVAHILFSDKSFYRVENCFALAQTDQVFGGVFLTVLGEIAKISGLNIG